LCLEDQDTGFGIVNRPLYVVLTLANFNLLLSLSLLPGVPRQQPHRRSGLANLPSVGAVP